jgi:predicted nucleotidyltransferase
MFPTELKDKIKEKLHEKFGQRFVAVIFYGSRVRGTEQADSDLDALVILKGPLSLWKDTYAAVQAIYAIQLELDFPIHMLPVDARHFEEEKYQLYRSARQEGLAA